MRLERQQYLGVAPYQRSPERRGHGNGFKPKTERTRLGEITFAIPQVREGGFFPQALEKGLRSERALTLALAEMYVQGVSTRKVTAIVEKLCGSSVSSSQVSRAAQLLDDTLAAWRQQPLGEMVYLYLDARYEKVRQDGQIRSAAVLIATGVDPSGHRRVLGVSVSLNEREVHPGQPARAGWRTFVLRRSFHRPAQSGQGWPPGPAAHRQRRPPGSQSGVPGGLRRGALATLPIPSATECPSPCASQGHAGGSGGRYSHHLQRAQPGHRGCVS